MPREVIEAIGAAGPAPGDGAALKRTLGLGLLVLYGLGVTVGAGIYVLVGAAAGRAGVHAPVAFILAAIVMGFSAASFAELSARFPVSAGEAAYVEAGLGSRWLALVVGGLVVLAGIVSAAAISQGAAGYIGVLLPAPAWLLTTAVVVGMGLIAAYGITEAVALAAVMTLVEITGLAAIVIAGVWREPGILLDLPLAGQGLADPAAWSGILGATLIAFFAFIGFESMVNVAEEVKEPERTVPCAIAVTIVLSTILYILVVWVVMRSVPAADLAAEKAPISLAYQRLTGASPWLISLIAIFATINGVIVQMVMASRVLYGLARQGALPRVLGHINRSTKTPLLATSLIVVSVLALAVSFPLDRLAEFTTHVMLIIFVLVNASLLALKMKGEMPRARIEVPRVVPALGVLTSLGLLVAGLFAH